MNFKQTLIEQLKDNSDKVNYHGYHEIYAESLPQTLETLVEIGISIDGSNLSSLNAWSNIYPNAEIIGLDNVEEKLINSKNITSYLVDQSSASSIKSFLKQWNGMANVIIDDGSHNVDHYLMTFLLLFPRLKEDGVYFIEDVWGGKVLEKVKYFMDNTENITYKVHDRTSTNNPDSIIIEIRHA